MNPAFPMALAIGSQTIVLRPINIKIDIMRNDGVANKRGRAG